MALRSGYKGFKKLLPGLKIIRPGTLGIDNDELSKTFFTRSDQAVLGVRNLLPCPYASGNNYKDNGITYAFDSDGVVTANGTATGAGSSYVLSFRNDNNLILPQGKYTLSGAPANEDSALTIGWNEEGSLVEKGRDNGNGITLDINTSNNIDIRIVITSGKVCDNLKFYPMLRIATDLDSSYVPYAMTNRDLTKSVILEDISSSITLNEQTAYEVTSFKVAKLGKLVMISGNIKSLTENAMPSGRSYIQIASGLPKPLWDANFMLQPSSAGNQAQGVIVGNNSNFQLRGGTTNAAYTFTATYLSK